MVIMCNILVKKVYKQSSCRKQPKSIWYITLVMEFLNKCLPSQATPNWLSSIWGGIGWSAAFHSITWRCALCTWKTMMRIQSACLLCVDLVLCYIRTGPWWLTIQRTWSTFIRAAWSTLSIPMTYDKPEKFPPCSTFRTQTLPLPKG